SAVGNMLAEMGCVVIDTDDLAHELLAAPNPTYRKVLRRFGRDLVNEPGGPIDRKKLGACIFSDPNTREELNQIMHPAITRLMHRRIREHKKHTQVIAVLVPLLFECELESHFHEVWAVIVDEAMQLQRLKERNRLSDEEAQARIDAQMDQEEKARR